MWWFFSTQMKWSEINTYHILNSINRLVFIMDTLCSLWCRNWTLWIFTWMSILTLQTHNWQFSQNARLLYFPALYRASSPPLPEGRENTAQELTEPWIFVCHHVINAASFTTPFCFFFCYLFSSARFPSVKVSSDSKWATQITPLLLAKAVFNAPAWLCFSARRQAVVVTFPLTPSRQIVHCPEYVKTTSKSSPVSHSVV